MITTTFTLLIGLIAVIQFPSPEELAAPPEKTPTFQPGPPPPDVMYVAERAAAAFREREFETVLKILDDAGTTAEHPELLNIRGAALTELLRFDQAAPYFKEALKLNPDAFWPAHNLAEIDFLLKNYDQARTQFEKLRKKFPQAELLDFKIYLCDLLSGNDTQARVELDEARENPGTALHLLYEAAWAFHHGNRDTARKAFRQFESDYAGKSLEFYRTIFADQGWILRSGLY